MAQVELTIGDRHHLVACRDGEEDRLRSLAGALEAHWPAAVRAAGGPTGERTMLFVALMLADQIEDAARRPGEAERAASLDSLAERLEAVATSLEKYPSSA